MAGSSDDLAAFVRDALAQHIPRERIESALVDAGWSPSKVSQALRAFAVLDFPVPVPRPQAYLSAREAFLYLLLFSTLFLAAYHLAGILFELIEWALPSPTGGQFSADSLRWHVATLVVAGPLYLHLTLRQERELASDPTLRASRVRKWLTYVTLFVAASFLIGDLVTLIYYVLGGEYSLRFLLKVLVVAAIPGSALLYYLRDIRKDDG